MKITIPHAEFRRQRWYAVLDVPAEIQHLIGKGRLVKSTLTGDHIEARRRVPVLIAQWKAEIAKARGTLPDPKDTFWDSLGKDHAKARADGDAGAQFAVEALIWDDLADPQRRAHGRTVEESSAQWKRVTGLTTPLQPLVTAWKATQGKKVKKTIDQAYRDVSRMADHFVSLEALEPKAVNRPGFRGGCLV